MSKSLFPPEILDFSAEAYYSKLNMPSRIIYSSVSFLAVLIIALLPVIRIDISTQNRGIVRSPSENTIIQSTVHGEIVYYALAENKSVSIGDTLLIVNTEQIDEKIRLEIRKRTDNNLFIQDLNSLLNEEGEMQTSKYKAEHKRYLSKMKENKTNLDYLRKELDIAQGLYDKNIISGSEYLKEKNSWEQALSSVGFLSEEYRTGWQNEQTRLELENKMIESSIRQMEKEKNNYLLLAPVSGTLMQVAGFQSGNFIAPNQTIATICVSDSLLIECYLSPFDIGYITKGQDVVCQIDAYDYRYWGALAGSVVEISDGVTDVSGKPMFRVRCNVESTFLQLKNGYKGYLKNGMTVTCRFRLTRRSLWELLFDKVDNWMNPKVFIEK
jgi:hypothetical protein